MEKNLEERPCKNGMVHESKKKLPYKYTHRRLGRLTDEQKPKSVIVYLRLLLNAVSQ
jgi:hypothetical protein